ncbi:MAG: hypothetical protein A2Y15_00205 [Clostridiales bacterium GWF2_36_10]|nr:MAG: hypothetical protein A2Y15_00205 [Clostridiales bacterium GWF2_36_10]
MQSFKSKIVKIGSELSIIGIILIILLSFVFFYNFSQKSAVLTEDANKTQLSEIALQTSNHVKTKASDLLNFIEYAAEEFFNYEKLDSTESITKLKLINKSGSFDRIRIVLPDGKSFDENGNYIDISKRSYLTDAFNGNSGVSDVLESILNSSKIIVYYAPIYNDSKVVGILTGVYEINSLSAATDMSSFGGNGFADIIQVDGDVIIASKNSGLRDMRENAFSYLANAEFENGFSLENLKNEIKNGENGVFEYTVNDNKYYTYYMPVDENDWYVMQTVPETVIATHTGYINDISMILLLKVIFIFVIVIIIISYYSRLSRKKIDHAKQLLNNVLNAIPGGVVKCLVNNDYKFALVSDGFLNIIGYTKNELVEKSNDNLLASVHPDDRMMVRMVLSAQNSDKVTELEYRIITSAGNIIWVLNKCVRTTDKIDGNPCLYCTCIDTTNTKKAQQDLILSNERFRMAMEQTSNIVFEYDSETDKIHFVTRTGSYYRLLPIIAHGPSYFIENGIVCDEFAENFINCFKSISNPNTNMISLILKLKRADGKIVWNKLTLSSINDYINNSRHSIGTFEDITQEKKAQLQHKREEKYRSAMLSDAISTYEVNLTNDCYIKTFSKENNYHIENLNESYGNILKKLCDSIIYPEDKIPFLNIYNRENLISEYENGRLVLYNEYRHLDENGQAFWVSCTTNLLSDPENEDIKAFSYIKNIDAIKRKELAIKYNSERDPLTELYNRKATHDLITDFLSNPNTSSEKNAFLSIDLDSFKLINDKYGHVAGDEVLTRVSICLKSVFRNTDIVARMGGDEFVVFMKSVESKVDILSKALEACTALKKLTIDSKSDVYISASMGIALSPINGDSFEELYRNSDKALYYAKKTGKDRCVFYTSEMDNLT